MRRLFLWLLVGVLLLVVLAAAYAGWRAWQVRADLQAAAASARELRTALADGDQQAADRELAELQDRSASAAERTDGPLWSVLAAVPVVGDDAGAVRTVSRTLDDLARGGLAPLVESAAVLDAGSFAPRNGTFPLEAIAAMAEPVRSGREAFAAADERLSQVDQDGLTAAVRGPVEDFAEVVSDGSDALAAADTAVRLLPPMLGERERRRYLVVFQNNAEARATGGMPGAVAMLEADGGRIELSRTRPIHLPELDKPILPLTKEEQAVFGPQLGVYFQDANFTPHFPRAAELLAARWERDLGPRVDGVLSVDPVALSYVLEATGPLTVDGIELSAETAVDELLNQTYLRESDPQAQDEFFAEVAKQVFGAVSSGTGSPQTLVRALARGAEEGRLLVHSFREREQRRLTGTRVAGEFPSGESDRPQVAVHLNDATGSKMSYYLDYTATVTSTSCADDGQRLAGRLDMTSETPPDPAELPVFITGGGLHGVPAGSQLLVTDVYGPTGGTLENFVLDGKKIQVEVEEYRGRPVASLVLFFDPGQVLDLTWQMSTGEDQDGDIDVRVTPGAEPENESSTAPSSCGE